MAKVQELEACMREYIYIYQHKSQSLFSSEKHVRSHLDMFCLDQQFSNIMTPPNLSLESLVEDPSKTIRPSFDRLLLRYYYNSLGSVTFIEDDRAFVR